MILGFFVVVCGAVGYVPFMSAQQAALRVQTSSPVRDLAESILIYASEHDDRLPLAKWQDAVSPYFGRMVESGAARDSLPSRQEKGKTIAFHKRLVGVQLSRIEAPAVTAMLYLSTQIGPNAVGEGSDLRFVQESWTVIGFADGSARMRPKALMDRSVFRVVVSAEP